MTKCKMVFNLIIWHYNFYENDYHENVYSFNYFLSNWPVNKYDLTHRPSHKIQAARSPLVIAIFTDRLHPPDAQPVSRSSNNATSEVTDLNPPPWPFLKHIRNTPVVMTPTFGGQGEACAAHASVLLLFCLSNGAATTGAVPLRHCGC